MKKSWVISLGAIAIAGTATVAQGQSQFTFNVPVELKAMTPDVKPFVACYVGSFSSFAASSIAEGRSAVLALDSNGNYTGTVTVSFSVPPDKQSTSPAGWRCQLRSEIPPDYSSSCAIGGYEVSGLVNLAPAPICRIKASTAIVALTSGQFSP